MRCWLHWARHLMASKCFGCFVAVIELQGMCWGNSIGTFLILQWNLFVVISSVSVEIGYRWKMEKTYIEMSTAKETEKVRRSHGLVHPENGPFHVFTSFYIKTLIGSPPFCYAQVQKSVPSWNQLGRCTLRKSSQYTMGFFKRCGDIAVKSTVNHSRDRHSVASSAAL